MAPLNIVWAKAGRKAALLAIFGLISIASPSTAAEPASWPARPAAAADTAQLYVLSFTDQDIAAVAGQVLGVVMQAPFDLDPAVKGSLTFHVEARLTRGQLLAAFETALASRDTVIVKRNGVLTLVPRPTLPAASLAARRRAVRNQHRPDSVSPALLDMTVPLAASPSARPTVQPLPRSSDKLGRGILIGAGLCALAIALAALLARAFGVSIGQVGRSDQSSAREAVLTRLNAANPIPAGVMIEARLIADRSGRPVERVLHEMGAVGDDALVAAYAAVTGCRIWRPQEQPAITGETAFNLRQRGLVPIESGARRLTLATSDPLDHPGLAKVARETSRTVTILVGSPGDIRRASQIDGAAHSRC